ncbi:MAG: hypothetical protein IJY25_04860 [Bacilli bacterium]|nr:hypothetical protein [Bacilli bacterium]
MKIMTNYDLLSKVQETKTGFSVQRTVKPILIRTGINFAILMGFDALHSLTLEDGLKEILENIMISLMIPTFTIGTADLILSHRTKNISKDILRKLSMYLKEINVNTDSELILESYKYKTEYEFNKDKEIIQKKYIMIPVIENSKENEISVLQEHVIGTKEYLLSCGEPTKQKVFKLALNPM